jgi:hypothetical protein
VSFPKQARQNKHKGDEIMTAIDEKSNNAGTPETYELTQARCDYNRRINLWDRYGYKTLAVLDELLLGNIRRDTFSGMKIVRFLDQEIAEDLRMDIDDVRYALDTLQKDGLLYWHRLSGLVIRNSRHFYYHLDSIEHSNCCEC